MEIERLKFIAIGVAIIVISLFLALGLARGHGTHVEEPDGCNPLGEKATRHGSFLQYCDFDGDGEAELVQEIIWSQGRWHYLNIRGIYENETYNLLPSDDRKVFENDRH